MFSTLKNQAGQALVSAIAFLCISAVLLTGLFQAGLTLLEKVSLQLAADRAVLSALTVQTNGLNAVALGNRAILSNDALAAKLNAVLCETSFYRELAERFSHVLKFIPSVGTVLSTVITRSGRALEQLLHKLALAVIPATRAVNGLISRGQEIILVSIPPLTLRTARQVLENDCPGAEISPFGYSLILRQAMKIPNGIENLEHPSSRDILLATMDRHTLQRNWRAKIGRIKLPIKKTGGSTLNRNDIRSRDSLQLKRLTWRGRRWRTVLSWESRASRYGFRGQSKLKTLTEAFEPPSFTLLVHINPKERITSLPSIGKLTAVSAGQVYYQNPQIRDEKPNLFNPFWRSRLIPVASEPSAVRLVPRVILREVRH